MATMNRPLAILILTAPACMAFLGLQRPRGLEIRGSPRPLLSGKAPMLRVGGAIGSCRSGRASFGNVLMKSKQDSKEFGDEGGKGREPSAELLEARKADLAVEIEKIEENMLATLRRRRRLMKRLGKFEQMQQSKDGEDGDEGEKAAKDFTGEIKTFCTCEEFNMPHALRRLRIWSGGKAKYVDEGRVIHIQKRRTKSNPDQPDVAEGDIFVFPYGVLVCWGVPDDLVDELLEISQFFSQRISPDIEEDDYLFTYGDDFDYVTSKDCLVLKTVPDLEDKESLEQNELEKLAASHGFAQSSKLSSFAEGVQRSIIATRGLAAELAAEGSIVSASQKDIARNLGQLVLDRHTIYLYADVLDSPDVCWENPEVDPLYKLVERFLELSPRVELLNKRVEVVRELLSLLSDELKNKHAARLEEIIIYLITIEIALTLIKDIVPAVWETVQGQMAAKTAAMVAGSGSQVAGGALVTAAAGHAVTMTMEGIVSVTIVTMLGVAMSGIIFAGLFLLWEEIQPLQRLKKWRQAKAMKSAAPRLTSTRIYNSSTDSSA